MNKKQWEVFKFFRNEYKKYCIEWNKMSAELRPLQIEAAKKDTPPYSLETSIVYNILYDEITPEDRISLIVVGDNPGKEEQLLINTKYLVGQSGRIAEGFFKRNPGFNIDFRKNVLITNKTPVHTAKTSHLKYLKKNGSKEVCDLLLVSQCKMAELTAGLHKGLNENREDGEPAVSLWLVGYSELKDKGIFLDYKQHLRNEYLSSDKENMIKDWSDVYVYQHFSMNRFLIDLNEHCGKTNVSFDVLKNNLQILGWKHRKEIFGC